MTATINVNLQQCDTPHLCAANGGENVSVCAARPVPIPCPIPPTFGVTVRLGECSLGNCYAHNPDGTPYSPETGGHGPGCPARPVRVTCAIGGDGTWAGSEVTGVSDVRDATGAWIRDNHERILSACRDRWALVKALVLSGPLSPRYTLSPAMIDMIDQRNAVFAALAKARRAEDALIEALGDYEEAMRAEPVGIYGLKRESDWALTRYVKRIIEQVATL